MTRYKQKIGSAGERLVQQYLTGQGWEVIATNLHTRHGELDIVVRKGRQVVVVEVKTRRSRCAASAVESLTPQKFAKLRHSAWEAQTAGRLPRGPVRFALAAVQVTGKTAHLTLHWNLGPASWR